MEETEEACFQLGKYYDQLRQLVPMKEKPQNYGQVSNNFNQGDIFYSCYRDVLHHTVQYYGAALRHGNKFIYNCMPHAVSLWLEYGRCYEQPPKSGSKEQQSFKVQFSRVNKVGCPHTVCLCVCGVTVCCRRWRAW